MYLYYFLGAISIWFGFKSLLNGLRYAAYVRQETNRTLADYQPFVTVIAPGRGLEAGLEDNLRALLRQQYRAYEILFVFDSESDPAVALTRILQAEVVECDHLRTKIIIAGPAVESGQKVHNLREAIQHLASGTEVLVFVDTDARPGENWLRQLVAPLADESLGASSGYRWFVSLRGGIFSGLRSVWNASVASALGQDRERNFCWGGSTAIRRETFERLQVKDGWQGSVSDDFTLTNLLHEAKLPIHFNANCLVPSLSDCDFHELLEFTSRQIKITRVYSPHLWKPILIGGLLFGVVFFGGIALLLTRLALGQPFGWLLAILGAVFLLGALKSFVRWRVVNIPLRDYRAAMRRDLPAHVFLWPVASLLYLYNAILAGLSRRIAWRGITYELKSPNEAVIISRSNFKSRNQA